DLNDAIRTHHDVFWLDVTMDNSFAVREAESLSHLRGIVDSTFTRKGSDHLPQRLAFDKLHDHELQVALPVKIMDGDYVAMVKSAGGLGFQPEALDEGCIFCKLARQNLQNPDAQFRV